VLIETTAVLFDMDGTLVDSSAAVIRAWTQWSSDHGLDINKVLSIAHGRQPIDTMRLVAPALATQANADKILRREVEDLEGVVEVPGASELLRSLPSGSWAVVTSARRELALARIRAAKLPEPEHLISAEDVKKGKPDPEPYEAGARLLKVRADYCVAFEDAPAGIQSALSAGATVVAVKHASPDLSWKWEIQDFRSLRLKIVSGKPVVSQEVV
jgi:sugar-phosphatase